MGQRVVFLVAGFQIKRYYSINLLNKKRESEKVLLFYD